MSSDPAGLKLRSLKRKEPASKDDVETVDVDGGEADGAGEAVIASGTPRPKKGKASRAANVAQAETVLFTGGSEGGGTSSNAAVLDSFWHSSFDFRRYELLSIVSLSV